MTAKYVTIDELVEHIQTIDWMKVEYGLDLDRIGQEHAPYIQFYTALGIYSLTNYINPWDDIEYYDIGRLVVDDIFLTNPSYKWYGINSIQYNTIITKIEDMYKISIAELTDGKFSYWFDN